MSQREFSQGESSPVKQGTVKSSQARRFQAAKSRQDVMRKALQRLPGYATVNPSGTSVHTYSRRCTTLSNCEAEQNGCSHLQQQI